MSTQELPQSNRRTVGVSEYFFSFAALAAWVLYLVSIPIDFLRGCNPFVAHACDRYDASLDHMIMRGPGNLLGILTPVHRLFPPLVSPESTPSDWIILPSFTGAVVNMTVAIGALILINLAYVWVTRRLKV